MKITDALIVEHGVFRRLFGQIEQELPHAATREAVRVLARLVEGLLRVHAELEEEVVFAALDHLLEHRGERDRFYQEHQEIDALWQRVHAASVVAEARRRLLAAFEASRCHFSHEEAVLFPLVASTMRPEMLEHLGECWEHQAARAKA